MTKRRTQVITYNLKDRGRKHTGQDRGSVDVPSLVKMINSAAVQEMVATNSMLGYYGHQVRQRFGMTPPETAFIDGREIRLQPAVRTVMLEAKPDGTVRHQQEFFDNEAGEYARKQFAAKVGGFSSAINTRNMGGMDVPTGFYGYDYVFQPNYAGNTGAMLDGLMLPADGACFDSVADPMAMLAKEALEQTILSQYDSIHMAMAAMANQGMALDQIAALQQENMRLIQQEEKRKQMALRQKQRQQELYDNAICERVELPQFLQDAKRFDAVQPARGPRQENQPAQESAGRLLNFVFG